MNYKVGDKIRIKSYEELKREIDNGLKFKSNKWLKTEDDYIFGIHNTTIDLLCREILTIDKIEDYTFKVKESSKFNPCPNFYTFPVEFIKTEFKLPKHLFEI